MGGDGDDTTPPRSDFGDTIYFEMADVKDGEARVKFRLNDQITAFRITVHAVTSDNKVGVNIGHIVSKLPLSIVTVKPMNIKMLDSSREYWLSKGIKDWGIVLDDK